MDQTVSAFMGHFFMIKPLVSLDMTEIDNILSPSVDRPQLLWTFRYHFYSLFAWNNHVSLTAKWNHKLWLCMPGHHDSDGLQGNAPVESFLKIIDFAVEDSRQLETTQLVWENLKSQLSQVGG